MLFISHVLDGKIKPTGNKRPYLGCDKNAKKKADNKTKLSYSKVRDF